MKLCYKCKETKALSEFTNNRHNKSGKDSYCKPCRVVYNQSVVNRPLAALAQIKSKLKINYGITTKERQAQLEYQNYQCAICKKDLRIISPHTIHIDHCHLTKRLRGILCGACNCGLGHFQDSEKLLQQAINYLEIAHWNTESLLGDTGWVKKEGKKYSAKILLEL